MNGFRCRKCGMVCRRFLLTRNYRLCRRDGYFSARSIDLANITVTIEGEVNEVIATLKGMAGWGPSGSANEAAIAETSSGLQSSEPLPAESSAPESAMDAPAELASVVWNPSYLTTFWRNLSDTAREAMIRVSRSPNHTQKRAQLMHTLRLSQRELSGSLSSQGHSLNRLKRRRGNLDLPRPLTYDRGEDAYVLDPNFADALRELGMS